MSITVGVVGLGAMGSAIAIRLCEAGFNVIGLDLSIIRILSLCANPFSELDVS